jgi:hypothetical protein
MPQSEIQNEINEFLKLESESDLSRGKSAIAGFVMAYVKSFCQVMQQENIINIY